MSSTPEATDGSSATGANRPPSPGTCTAARTSQSTPRTTRLRHRSTRPFSRIFKNCAAAGNCGGMALLAIAAFKYGAFFGYKLAHVVLHGPRRRRGPRSGRPPRGNQHHAGTPVQRAWHPQLPRCHGRRRVERRLCGVDSYPGRPRQWGLPPSLAFERPLRRRRPHHHPLPRHAVRRHANPVGLGPEPPLRRLPGVLRPRSQSHRHHRTNLVGLRPERWWSSLAAPSTPGRTTAGSSPSRLPPSCTRGASPSASASSSRA